MKLTAFLISLIIPDLKPEQVRPVIALVILHLKSIYRIMKTLVPEAASILEQWLCRLRHSLCQANESSIYCEHAQ